MADVTNRLPYPLSKKLSTTVAQIIARNGAEIHYTIAGVPFRLATSPDLPMTWETAPAQKQQQDQEPEAGEQTLSGWWLRSQASWHEGAGARFTENQIGESLRVQASFGFWQSSNVDVWTQGQLSLLPATSTISGAAGRLSVALIPTTTAFTAIVGGSGNLIRYSDIDAGTSSFFNYQAAGVNFTQVIATETEWFAAGNDGKVYSAPIGTVNATPISWTLTGANVAKPTRICWAKHRLWAVNGNKIYELTYTAPGAEAAIYSHPTTGWTYSDCTDGPGGVLFSGYGDGTSGIHRITLNTDGGIPTLAGAATVTQLPTDEKVLRICSLANQMVCMVTNYGIRVAVADLSGNLTYGPRFLERTTEVPDTAIPCICTAGRFWYVAFGDENKLWRIDSSVQPEDGVFAYASDMETTSPPVSVTVRKGRVVLVTAAGTVNYSHLTQLCSTGYLQTGRIRFRTDEFKTYHYIDVTAAPLAGSVVLDTLNDADSAANVLTWSDQGKALPSAQFPAQFGTQRFVSVKLTLTRSTTDATAGPIIYGVRVKALPASRPQRIYTLPLRLYDRERWSTGQEDGYDGFARDRYLQVRAAEDVGGIVLLVNYMFPSPAGELCRIEEMKYVQLKQPDANPIDGGMGGVLLVTLRTLT